MKVRSNTQIILWGVQERPCSHCLWAQTPELIVHTLCQTHLSKICLSKGLPFKGFLCKLIISPSPSLSLLHTALPSSHQCSPSWSHMWDLQSPSHVSVSWWQRRPRTRVSGSTMWRWNCKQRGVIQSSVKKGIKTNIHTERWASGQPSRVPCTPVRWAERC